MEGGAQDTAQVHIANMQPEPSSPAQQSELVKPDVALSRPSVSAARNADAEALLVLTLRTEITRQGGTAKLPTLLTYCPAARPLLGDRRLLEFFREHPETFVVTMDVTSTTVLHTKAQEGKRHPNVMHTVRVLELASADDLRSAAANNHAVQAAARQVAQCVQWRLEELAREEALETDASTPGEQRANVAGQPVQHPSAAFAVLAQHSRLKRALIAHMRISPTFVSSAQTTDAQQPELGAPGEELSPTWWVGAFEALHGLLAARPDTFVLSTPTPPDNLTEMRAIRVALTIEASVGCLKNWEQMRSDLCTAIRRLLKRAGEEELSLARIGQDGAVRKAARGTPLLKAVSFALGEDQDQGGAAVVETGLQLVHRPPPADVSVRLTPSGNPCSAFEARTSEDNPPPSEEPPSLLPVDVLATGNGAAIVAKPPGISTEAWMYSVGGAIVHEFDRGGPIPSVSRLDKATSGVMVVPTSKAGEVALTKQFKDRSVDKTYTALVRGVTEPHGTIDAKLHVSNDKHHFRVYVSPKGKPAVTEYRRLQLLRLPEHAGCSDKHSGDTGNMADAIFSLLEVKPLTGRTHQIRAHFAARGHPLVSDTKYKPKVAKRQLTWCPRLFLHATRIRVRDVDGAVLDAEATLPDDLQMVLEQMEEVTT